MAELGDRRQESECLAFVVAGRTRCPHLKAPQTLLASKGGPQLVSERQARPHPSSCPPQAQFRPSQSLGASDNPQNTRAVVKFLEWNPSSSSNLECDLESLAVPLSLSFHL